MATESITMREGLGFAMSRGLLLLFCASFIGGCAPLFTLNQRVSYSEKIAYNGGFAKETIKTKTFNLISYTRFSHGKELTVYIEGDGYAWISKSRPSGDPTPKDPVALKLASIDGAENVAYLARPCQYVRPEAEPHYNAEYWTNRRFSEEVIDSMDEAISELASLSKAKKIHLVGFSGGAAVAVLLASKRDDIASIRTVAGNLNIEAVSRYHGVSQLTGSLNPAEYAEKIKKIPQTHYVSDRDRIVPAFIAEDFVKIMGNPDSAKVVVVKGCAHTKGWTNVWLSLLEDLASLD